MEGEEKSSLVEETKTKPFKPVFKVKNSNERNTATREEDTELKKIFEKINSERKNFDKIGEKSNGEAKMTKSGGSVKKKEVRVKKEVPSFSSSILESYKPVRAVSDMKLVPLGSEVFEVEPDGSPEALKEEIQVRIIPIYI